MGTILTVLISSGSRPHSSHPSNSSNVRLSCFHNTRVQNNYMVVRLCFVVLLFLYREPILGPKGNYKNCPFWLSSANHQLWASLYSQQGGCSCLCAIDWKNTFLWGKKILEVSSRWFVIIKIELAYRDIYWRLALCCSYDVRRKQMDSGYPRFINWDFRGIGSRVDAVFENYGEKLYFCVWNVSKLLLILIITGVNSCDMAALG